MVVAVVTRSDLGLQLPACPAEPLVKSRATCDGLGVVCGSAAGWRQSSVGERSLRSHDGSALLGPAASWAIWSLGASLVRKFGPQAAGKQVTDRGLAVPGAT